MLAPFQRPANTIFLLVSTQKGFNRFVTFIEHRRFSGQWRDGVHIPIFAYNFVWCQTYQFNMLFTISQYFGMKLVDSMGFEILVKVVFKNYPKQVIIFQTN